MGVILGRLRTLQSSVTALDMDTAKPPPKETLPFYYSKEWLGLMARIKRERGMKCEQCDRVGVRLFGDHVVELKDGGAALDAGNVRLLCGSCHSTKTAQARRKRIYAPIGGSKV